MAPKVKPPKAAAPKAAAPKAAAPKEAPPKEAPPKEAAEAAPKAPEPKGAAPTETAPPQTDAPKAEAKPEAKPGAKTGEPKQSPEELAFYARNYCFYSFLAVLFFFPLGLIGAAFSYKTAVANRKSEWDDAYCYSAIAGWIDTIAILLTLGIAYYILFFY